jgi:fumarate reductase flavoprotein subunit
MIKKTLILFVCLFVAGIMFNACASTGKVVPIGNFSGTATGTASGFGGPVEVTITMADGYITEVAIKADGETQAIAAPAIMRAPNIIKEINSAQFDSISGASITSMAISEAAQDAIDQITGK